jgi:hypothetical protein
MILEPYKTIAITLNILLIVLYIANHVYNSYISNKQIIALLTEYFKNEGVEIVSVDKLSFNEALRYGTFKNVFWKYYFRFIFAPFRFGDKHFRRIEISGDSNEEEIVYVVVYIKRRRIIYCDELD